MKNKEKIRYLSQYRHLIDEIVQLKSGYKYLHDKIYDPKSATISDMPGAGGVGMDKMPSSLLRLEKLDKFLQQRISDLDRLATHIHTLILSVPVSIDRRIMHLKYIEGKTWPQIYLEIPYSESHIHTIHSRVLTNMEISKETWQEKA